MNTFARPGWIRGALAFLVMTMIVSCMSSVPAGQEWNRKDLEKIIDDWRVESNVPGVAVGISLPGRDEILIASGEANMEEHVPLKVDDQFQVASISKTFIAVEILRLAEDGRLGLDDPLNIHLPGTPHGDVVTIRQLLSHRSGYFDPIEDDPEFIPEVAKHPEKQWTWDEMLALSFKHNLFFDPGTGYDYSNTNYLLLGTVIEKVTEQRLGQVLTSDLIAPLHLEHTLYRTVDTDITRMKLTHGYDNFYLASDHYVDIMEISNNAILSVSNNTVVSNVPDLLKWSRSLYGKDATVLETTFKEQMLSFDDLSVYGLGVFQFQTPIGISIGHGGETAGYLALMEYFPKQDMSMVILVNANAQSINESALRDRLLATLYKDDLASGLRDRIADLKSEDVSVRKEAILALGHDGSNSEEATTGLIEVLRNDSVAENRKEAALALGLVGRGSSEAEQALTDALNDNDVSVREAAGLALSVLKYDH